MFLSHREALSSSETASSLEKMEQGTEEGEVEVKRGCGGEVPPCSLVWTPIAPITWCLPFVGHLGITDSRGRLHDWSGMPIEATHPRNMLFGTPARYVVLARPRTAAAAAAWDDAIRQADDEYARHIHCMAFGYDCHSHVARALNAQRYAGSTCHNKVVLAAWVFFAGAHVSVYGALKTWLPVLVVLVVVVASVYATP